MDPCEVLSEHLLKAERVVVFTGAGVSAESGIATFRDPQTGHWAKYDPMDLASPEGWKKNKSRVWAWYESRRALVMKAQPNAGHVAIAGLQRALEERTGRSVKVTVVTQNIDDLHERAGCDSVLHLHGSLFEPRCSRCEEPGDFAPDPPDVEAVSVEPPSCPCCGHSIRPGIVWFHEEVPHVLLEGAKRLAEKCDVMLVAGTSGTVYPANSIPVHAVFAKKFVASINPETNVRGYSLSWPETAAVALPQLLARIASM
jgi:NAD-dependent deacetylase